MSLIPNQNQTEKVKATEGTHVARIYKFIYLGEHKREWQGKQLTPVPRFSISFELPNERFEFSKDKGEQAVSVSTLINYSMSDPDRLKDSKSVFSRMLLALGGRQEYIKLYSHLTTNVASEAEAIKYINEYIEKFNTCMISVLHNEKGYANIDQFTEVIKGMQVPARENELVIFDFWKNKDKISLLPEFQVKMIDSSNNYTAFQQVRDEKPKIKTEESLPTINADDLNVQMPF